MPKPKHTISGYVAKSALRYTPQGLAVLSFSIAEKPWSKTEREGYKPAYSGTGFECTAWDNMTMFGDNAEKVNEWLDKGSFVECVVKPNGIAENGRMTPKIYKEKASYDYIVLECRQVSESHETEPPDFVEETKIPF